MATTSVTYNGAIPAQPQAINTFITINADRVLVDLTMQLAQGKIAGVQTLFVDLQDHLGDVMIYMPDTGQRIVAKAQTQGYYPVLSTNLMKFEVTSNVNGKFPIQFINFPIAGAVWGFNVIKGDKGADGEKGQAGENGGTVITIDSSSPDGESIALFDTDPDTGENFIMLKKLIAGDNITITDLGDALEISSTGGGGGGGGTPSAPDYIQLMLSPYAGGTSINAGELNDFDFSGALVASSRGSTFTAGTEGINFNSSGLYQVTINLDANKSTGKNLIRATVGSENFLVAQDSDSTVIGAEVDGAVLSFTTYANYLGVPSLDLIKIACCNLINLMDNYMVNITVTKIG